MKKVILVMILIFSLSIFTGCNESNDLEVDDYIMLSLDLSSNGQVVQSIYFSVGSENLRNNEVEETDINQFIINLQDKVSEIRNEFLINFALIYYLSPNEEFAINKGLLFTNVSYNEQEDNVGFDMIFTSLGAWNYYHNLTSSSNSGNEGGFLYQRNLSKGTFPFSASINLGDGEVVYVGERYRQRYIEATKGLNLGNIEEEYNPMLIYNYSTFYSRLHSDSDFKYDDTRGHTHHVWMVEANALTSDNTITIISYRLKTGTLYILALVFTIILGVVLYIILDFKRIKGYLKNRKQKNKK